MSEVYVHKYEQETTKKAPYLHAGRDAKSPSESSLSDRVEGTLANLSLGERSKTYYSQRKRRRGEGKEREEEMKEIGKKNEEVQVEIDEEVRDWVDIEENEEEQKDEKDEKEIKKKRRDKKIRIAIKWQER